jgi:hypothetical protein
MSHNRLLEWLFFSSPHRNSCYKHSDRAWYMWQWQLWRHVTFWRCPCVMSPFGVIMFASYEQLALFGRHINIWRCLGIKFAPYWRHNYEHLTSSWRHINIGVTLASSVTVQPGSRVQNHLAAAGICARVYTGVAAAVYHRLVRYLRPLPRWFELCLINLDRLEKVPTMHCFRMGPRRCLYYVQYLERQ